MPLLPAALFWIVSLCAVTVAEERPKIIGIAQVTFRAKDVGAARTFYRGLLGYDESSPGVFAVDDRQSVRIVAEDASGSDRLVGIALATDNAEALRVDLKAKGVAVPQAVSRDASQRPTFSIVDPDGHRVEFVERHADASPRAPQGSRVSTDLRHAGLLVGSLGSALRFYVDLLGFKETWRGSRDGTTLDWVNVQVPDGDDYIEFMLYRDLPAPDKRGTQHHICLFVDDLDRAASVLQGRVAETGYTRPLDIRTGINRKRQLNLYDPDGTRVELMEPRTVDGKPAPSSTAPPPRR
jgi:catechol 2,3-dioxygenase-like lactoylglutathione lyase family enzyme